MPTSETDSSADSFVQLLKGEILYEEGADGRQFYLIEEGEIELLKPAQGGPSRMALLGAGDVFGEDCLWQPATRRCSARVVSDCRLLPLDVSAFGQLQSEHPEILGVLLQRLSRRFFDSSAAPSASTDPDATASLARLVDVDTGREFPLEREGHYTIGRFDPATLSSPEVDLTELDAKRSLSRRHARLEVRGGECFLREEEGVANGTWVGSHRVGPEESRRLEDGDRLKLGLVELTFNVAQD